jgi:lipid A ethanolaminephosphotransferase
LVKIKRQTFFIESRDRILTAIVVMVVCVIMIWSNMKYLTYFGRENRDLRYFINPLFVKNRYKGKNTNMYY